jgi:RND family efflux transporter MFP subunit
MKKIKDIINWFKKDKKRLILAAVLVVGLVLTGKRIFTPKKTQTQIQTAKVEKGTIISSVSASGQMLTANVVNITSNAKGLIKEVYVKDGDTVTSGQKIMEISLDPEAEQRAQAAYASYLSAKNSLDSANVSLYTLQSDMLSKWKIYLDYANSASYDSPEERTATAFIIAQNDWLAAEAKFKNQQNVITQTKINLNNSWLSYQATTPIVTSPMNGTITNITYSPGMTISATADSSQRIAVIKAKGNPLASFNLSEIDVNKVKIGQKATIKLDSLTDKTFTGKVMTLDKVGTTTSGVTNYPAVIQLDTEAEDLLPNMAATASIIIDSKDNALLVPSSAIKTQGNQLVVQIIKGKQTASVNVETGLTSETQTEIISGLSEGDEIIISTTSTSGSQGGSSVFGGLGSGRMFSR